MRRVDKAIMTQEEVYDTTLEEYRISEVDTLMAQFNIEILALKESDALSNDRIRYYMHHFSYQMYRLRTIKARENLKASLSKQFHESTINEALLNLKAPEGRKYIKEEKLAIASNAAVEEERVAIVYRAISNAIDERIQGLDKMLYNLSTSANLNMSEARLTAKGGNIN